MMKSGLVLESIDSSHGFVVKTLSSMHQLMWFAVRHCIQRENQRIREKYQQQLSVRCLLLF